MKENDIYKFQEKLIYKEYIQELTEFYNKLSNNTYSFQDVLHYIERFFFIVRDAMPEPEIGGLDIAQTIYYGIDELLEMESISLEEKEKEIMDRIEENKEELKSLALQTIEQMRRDIVQTRLDIEAYFEFGRIHGYCTESLRKILDSYKARLE